MTEPRDDVEIVLGPPGTGKTFTLLDMVEDALSRGVPPDRIGYVSFTRKAAEEAITRACAKFGRERSDFPYFRTLHSLCYRMLGLQSSDVMERNNLKEFADYAGVRITGRWTEDGTFAGYELGDRVLFMENLARVRRVPLRTVFDEDDDTLSWNEVSRVAKALRSFKEQRGLMDYTDMLLEFVKQGVSPRLEELYGDEAQDMSDAQWDVFWQVAKGCKRVVVAGDDDQAIYRWAGASVDRFVEMRGRARVLDQSYRVPVLVQELSDDVISRVRKRRPKLWKPREARGEVGRAASFSTVDTSGSDVLVLARNDYVLTAHVEPLLRQQGVIYEKRGHPSISPKLLASITVWEKLRSGESATAGEVRLIYEYMSSGIGVARGFKKLPDMADEDQVGMGDLKQRGGLLRDDIWHEALDRMPRGDMSYLLSARRRGEKLRQRPRVRLSTIHGAKGGQAEHVVLMTEMAIRTHKEMANNLEDEARVWYVGVTRAKQKLTVVSSDTNRRCPWI
jgi:DNA helicase-2/ATP-dependent DNA helicase PcrA